MGDEGYSNCVSEWVCALSVYVTAHLGVCVCASVCACVCLCVSECQVALLSGLTGSDMCFGKAADRK